MLKFNHACVLTVSVYMIVSVWFFYACMCEYVYMCVCVFMCMYSGNSSPCSVERSSTPYRDFSNSILFAPHIHSATSAFKSPHIHTNLLGAAVNATHPTTASMQDITVRCLTNGETTSTVHSISNSASATVASARTGVFIGSRYSGSDCKHYDSNDNKSPHIQSLSQLQSQSIFHWNTHPPPIPHSTNISSTSTHVGNTASSSTHSLFGCTPTAAVTTLNHISPTHSLLTQQYSKVQHTPQFSTPADAMQESIAMVDT